MFDFLKKTWQGATTRAREEEDKARASSSQSAAPGAGVVDMMPSMAGEFATKLASRGLPLDFTTGQPLIAQLIERFTSAGLDSYFASLALGGLGEPAVAPLIRAVRSAARPIRYRASESLGRIGAPALDPVMEVLGTARLQFRVEMFNIFNQANLGLPGRFAATPSTSFGVITNTRFPTGDSGSARQVQFALKALF